MTREALTPSTDAGARGQFGRVLPGVLLFLSLLAVYYLYPVVVANDSLYTMLVSEHFLLTGNLALDEHFSPHVDSSAYPRVRAGRVLPRHVRPYRGHLYYLYPPGTPVLSAPLVGLMRVLFDESTVGEDGRYLVQTDRLWQKRVAALVTAATGLVIYFVASLILTPAASFAVALAAGLSTQFWSTASRGMAAHTWLVLELSLVLYLLVRWRVRGAPLRPVLLGTLLSAAFFTRPTAAAIILPLTVYVLARDRRQGAWLVSTGAVWLTLLVAHSYSSYGQPLPPYYLRATSLSLANIPVALAGQLISPSRGLFVYVPLTVLALYLVVRNWRFLTHSDLVLAVLTAIGIQTVAIAMWTNWWGGSSYGPRFLTDLIPLYAVVGIAGYAAMRRRLSSPNHGRPVVVWFLVLTLLGAVINGAGALTVRGRRWNVGPPSIAARPSRAFDWNRSQIMCALFESQCPPLARRSTP